MGTRLLNEKLNIEADLNIPFELLLRGAVQVLGYRDAVVLLDDHQTTGDYPLIVMIVSMDLDRMSQFRPQI